MCIYACEPERRFAAALRGASANLNDQMLPLRPVLEGRADMLFLNRPGHGWSAHRPEQ
jgi:hypothetical protein